MITAETTITWGKWSLRGTSLAIPAPAGSLYSVPAHDLINGLDRFWITQLACKRWTTIEDILDLKQAIKHLKEYGYVF